MFWKSIFCPSKSTKNKKDDAESPSMLEDLPSELKCRVGSFLPVRDLLTLAETSKLMSSELGIAVVSSPLTDQNKAFATAYSTQLFAAIVAKHEKSLDPCSTIFSCTIVADKSSDGAVWIVEQDLSKDQSKSGLENARFSGGKVVAMAWTRPKTKLVLQFLPKPNKYYQFYVNTRGYTERTTLRLHSMKIYRIGLGNKKPSGYSAFQYDWLPWYIQQGRW